MAEERRYQLFKGGRLAGVISSIPGALTPASSWPGKPLELAFASGQVLLARFNDEIRRIAEQASSFDELTVALERANYRLREGEVPTPFLL